MTDRVRRSERKPPRRRRGGAIARVVLAFICLLVAVSAVVGWQMLFRPANPVAAGQQIEFTVSRGESVELIGEALARDGIVRNALMFRLMARNSDQAAKLKPGTYKLATGMPYDLVLDKLVSGPDVVYYSVTIPEGFSARQIAARFAKETGVPEDEMLDLVLHGAPEFEAEHPYLKGAYDGSLEGFLFPKTYRVKEGTKSSAIVEMMLDQFDKEISSVDMSYAKRRNLDMRDVVIIASILERETKLAREFPKVSSVIYNRLASRMRLQLCATVLYTLPEGTTTLRDSDLAKPTPWNTYRRDGLPATPISNPGIKALEAAVRPSKTKYLYYVLTGKDGSQTFTTNYADFLKAKQRNRQVFGN